jgi:NADPH-dependent ferric siderophore reductase
MRRALAALQYVHQLSNFNLIRDRYPNRPVSKHKKKKHKDAGIKKKKKMLPAQVETAEWVGERFRLVDILAKGCRGVKWQPGAKVKIDIGDSMTRTYTPIAISSKSGRLRILVYIHSQSPASQWASAIAAGDVTYASIPRSSLDLNQLSSAVVFFGDETSFGTAKTLQSHLGSNFSAYCVFEVRQPQQAEAVVKRLELANVTLVQTREDRSHLGAITRRLQKALADLSTQHLVLTGNGRSIQAVRAALRANNTTEIEYLVKAYWTPEKTLED